MTPGRFRRESFTLALFLSMFGLAVSAKAQTFTLLHTFDDEDADTQQGPFDAAYPSYPGTLAQGRGGNLFGSTPGGGALNAGAVYSMTPGGISTVLHSFNAMYNGEGGAPAGLTLGTDGNFYGTTMQGGTSELGMIFKITPSGTLTVLHSFTGSDGQYPYAAPIQARDGNFYGTTSYYGVAYKLTPSGVFTKLCDLTNAPDPMAPLLQGIDGNFYGTAKEGGTEGYGAVFRLTSAGVVTIVYGFDHTQTHGSYPIGPVIQGNDGNLYGTTSSGGTYGDGVVFKLTLTGQITLLHSFDGTDGSQPMGGLVQASDGNFYGAASQGGAKGGGTLFEVTSNGEFSVLYNFLPPNPWQSNITGANPELTLLQHTNGLLYGDTNQGGVVPYNASELEGPYNGEGTFYSWNANLPPFVSLLPTSANEVGASIGMLGQGFTGATEVSFNGASGSFTVVSDTYMTAIVPSDATTGPVTVTTRKGKLTSNKTFFVVPTISSFSPSSGKAGTQVVILGSGLTEASEVTFGGVKATAFVVNSASQITATVPTGALTGPIAITTPGGTATSSGTFTVIL